jgi:hypothetical protein
MAFFITEVSSKSRKSIFKNAEAALILGRVSVKEKYDDS